MACLIITRMEHLVYVIFPTLEEAYFTGAKLFRYPKKYMSIIYDMTITSLFTIGFDSELRMQIYIGHGYPTVEGEIHSIEYLSSTEFKTHPIYVQRMNLG